MKYTIYVHYLKSNPELARYVGFTSREPYTRWNSGKGYKDQPFYKAIEKYGWENFEHKILEQGNAELSYISEREKYWCDYYNAYDTIPGGYVKYSGYIGTRPTFITVKDKRTKAPFLQINQDDWMTASKNLTGTAFRVYLLLAQLPPNSEFEYSPSEIRDRGITSKSSAVRARRELEEKGYIENGFFYVQSKEKRDKQLTK